jgi:urease accessory protein
MSKLRNFQLNSSIAVGLLLSLSLILAPAPASAHHAFGGETPSNWLEGFLSGVAHPVIGLDHFTFVVAIGLFAALKGSTAGFFIPFSFILATLSGTGLHLLNVNLPIPEVVIYASVLAFGILLTQKNSPNLVGLISLSILAGIFHGYAYGEAIVGAQMTPLIAYLSGFALVQLIVSLIAYQIGRFTLQTIPNQPNLNLRFAGFTICGVGAAFLATTLLG